jgi:thioredoxin reductase/SAM-dependent methyltransferase
MEQTYDVVVIGGGAAGLSGALALGRARRSVLVLDDGTPRNARAGHIHNYLGREGTAPGELLAIGRTELAQYGVDIVADRALSAEGQADGSFLVSLAGGSVVARRLLVATGLVDELPDLPGIAEGWGRTVLHCPYCHGWEVRDETVGVLGLDARAVHLAQLFRQLTDDVVLFQHVMPALDDDTAEQLAARGVRVVPGEVAGWEGGGVRLVSGDLVPRAALVVPSRLQARAEVLGALGLEPTPWEVDGQVYGSFVWSDPMGRTAVPGVWVAGNVTNPRAQVIVAAAAGLEAGAAINADLVAEDTRRAVERDRVFGAEAWEERYRSSDTGIWSGQPNVILVAEVSGLAPGRALDVGCGEGADALWLAERGWRVTAVDISTVALERAAAQGKVLGLDVDWQHADLLAEPPEAGAFDLVSVHFMHLPSVERIALFDRLADAVAPGGTLLLVGHHPSDLQTTMSRPQLPDVFFTAEQLAAELDAATWEVLVAEARPRPANDAEGRELTIHDTLLRARRR